MVLLLLLPPPPWLYWCCPARWYGGTLTLCRLLSSGLHVARELPEQRCGLRQLRAAATCEVGRMGRRPAPELLPPSASADVCALLADMIITVLYCTYTSTARVLPYVRRRGRTPRQVRPKRL